MSRGQVKLFISVTVFNETKGKHSKKKKKPSFSHPGAIIHG